MDCTICANEVSRREGFSASASKGPSFPASTGGRSKTRNGWVGARMEPHMCNRPDVHGIVVWTCISSATQVVVRLAAAPRPPGRPCRAGNGGRDRSDPPPWTLGVPRGRGGVCMSSQPAAGGRSGPAILGRKAIGSTGRARPVLAWRGRTARRPSGRPKRPPPTRSGARHRRSAGRAATASAPATSTAGGRSRGDRRRSGGNAADNARRSTLRTQPQSRRASTGGDRPPPERNSTGGHRGHSPLASLRRDLAKRGPKE